MGSRAEREREWRCSRGESDLVHHAGLKQLLHETLLLPQHGHGRAVALDGLTYRGGCEDEGGRISRRILHSLRFAL